MCCDLLGSEHALPLHHTGHQTVHVDGLGTYGYMVHVESTLWMALARVHQSIAGNAPPRGT